MSGQEIVSFRGTDTQILWNYSFKGKTRGKVRELNGLEINMLSVDNLNVFLKKKRTNKTQLTVRTIIIFF